MKVRYLPEADAEYQAAVTWYEEHSGAAEVFITAIERAERIIVAFPRTWPQWPGAAPGIHRYLVPGTLFAIAYRIRSDEILVLAIAHQSRQPFYWRSRDV